LGITGKSRNGHPSFYGIPSDERDELDFPGYSAADSFTDCRGKLSVLGDIAESRGGTVGEHFPETPGTGLGEMHGGFGGGPGLEEVDEVG